MASSNKACHVYLKSSENFELINKNGGEVIEVLKVSSCF
jgi:hypothetical protein